MGMIHNFAFTSVHAQINLLGWVSMEIFGIIYSIYPRAAESGLAKTHFWLHNSGVPLMQVALFIQILTGNQAIIIGSIMVVVGTLLFLINVFKKNNANQSIVMNKDITM